MSSVCGDSIVHSDIDEPLGFFPDEVVLYRQTADQTLLPDHAHSLAVEAFLRMCSLEYAVVERTNAADMSPSGRVPWVKCNEFVVPGLQALVEFLGKKGVFVSNLVSKPVFVLRTKISVP